jgi:hypothetical protein
MLYNALQRFVYLSFGNLLFCSKLRNLDNRQGEPACVIFIDENLNVFFRT